MNLKKSVRQIINLRDRDFKLSFFLTQFNRMDFEILISSNIVVIVQCIYFHFQDQIMVMFQVRWKLIMNRHQVQAVQMYMHKVLYFHFVKYFVFYQPFSVWKLFGLFIVKFA